MDQLPPARPLPGGIKACHPGLFPAWASNRGPFGPQADSLSTEPPRPGLLPPVPVACKPGRPGPWLASPPHCGWHPMPCGERMHPSGVKTANQGPRHPAPACPSHLPCSYPPPRPPLGPVPRAPPSTMRGFEIRARDKGEERPRRSASPQAPLVPMAGMGEGIADARGSRT